MTTYSDAGAVEVLVHVALSRGGMAEIHQRTLYPQVYPGLIERGLLEVLTEARGPSGQCAPQVVRLTPAGKAHVREALAAPFEELDSTVRRLCGDLLNLIFLKTRGNIEVPVLRDAAWEALGVAPWRADHVARDLYDRGLVHGDPDTFGIPEGSWFWWITQPGVWALREYFGVWDQQAEREVRLRSFAYLCDAWARGLHRELGDDRADRLARLVTEMRALDEDQPGRVAALGRETKQLLSGVEGESCKRARAILEAPSLVARRTR